jgi:hypothetical protein
MRRIALACFASLILRGTVASDPRQDTEPHSYGKANKEEIHAYVMLIRLRGDLYGRWKATGKWPDDPEANRALDAHSRYWQDQLHKGDAILAGGMGGDYWDNVALIIFEAEAESIVANDPAVKAYVFQAQVRPFDVHWVTNKFALQPPH